MKIFAAALLLVAVSFGANAQSNNDNALIGKARGAAHECLEGYNGSNLEIGAYVETVGICFVSGDLKRVRFYAGPKCNNPNEPCPRFMSIIIATVDFGCDGEIVNVSCMAENTH